MGKWSEGPLGFLNQNDLEQKGRVKKWPLCGNPPYLFLICIFIYSNSLILFILFILCNYLFQLLILFQNSCCLFHTPFLTHIIPSPDSAEDRLVERVSALEAPQPRLEKRLAELDGKVMWGEVEWDVADVLFP